jgi:hypothetical protein
VPYYFRIAADVAGVAQAGDRAQGKLLAAAGDQHRRAWLLDRLRLEDRVLGVKISPMEGRSPLRPQRQDEADGLLHLPDTDRGANREIPAILAVFRLEIAGADTERQPSPADQIDPGGDLGQMRGIAVADGGGERGEPNAAGDRGQPRQDGPAFHEWLVGRAHTADLD